MWADEFQARLSAELILVEAGGRCVVGAPIMQTDRLTIIQI